MTDDAFSFMYEHFPKMIFPSGYSTVQRMHSVTQEIHMHIVETVLSYPHSLITNN